MSESEWIPRLMQEKVFLERKCIALEMANEKLAAELAELKAKMEGVVPVDRELLDFAVSEQFLLFCDEEEFLDIAKSVLGRFARLNSSPVSAGATVKQSLTAGGVCRSEYKGGPEQTAEPTEAVEVVGYLYAVCGDLLLDHQKPNLPHEQLMTVAQHNRLMANHSADDINMVKVPRELVLRAVTMFDMDEPIYSHDAEDLRALLGGAG